MSPVSSPDIILVNGPVLSLDAREGEDPTGIAIRGRRIVDVGDAKSIRLSATSATKVIDLGGERAVVPGLVDGHYHLVYFGMTSSWLDLSQTRSAAEIVDAVRSRAAINVTPGSWIYGRGWDPAQLANGHAPDLTALDEAAPQHAVLLSRGDGHLCLANSVALRRAGISPATPDPPGGSIGRETLSGSLTGVLSEAALYLAWDSMMAELTANDFGTPVADGAMAAANAGVTSVHAVLLENVVAELEAIRRLDDSDGLPIRIDAFIPAESELGEDLQDLGRWSGARARIVGAKVFADGTLFAGTAAIRSPYADDASSVGQAARGREELTEIVSRIRDTGMQPAVHAVGDAAVETVLNVLEDVYGVRESRDSRPRIEHATVLAPDLVRRIANQGVVVSLQPGRRSLIVRRLGPERAAWVNPWHALADLGVTVVASSDAPFSESDPGPRGAIVEALASGLSVEQALKTATVNAAVAAKREHELGVLKPGMVADLTILSEDPRPPEPGLTSRQIATRFGEIEPAMTLVDGRIAWEAG